MKEKKTAALNIRRILAALGMTQAELEERAGISHVTLWRMLQDDSLSTPQLGTYKAVADALGVEVGQLYSKDLDVDALTGTHAEMPRTPESDINSVLSEIELMLKTVFKRHGLI